MCHISLLYSDYWTTVCFTQPVHICFVHSIGYNKMYLRKTTRENLKVTAHFAINLIHPDLLFYHRWNHCWKYDNLFLPKYDISSKVHIRNMSDYPIPGCYNEHYPFVFHTLIHKKVIPLQHKLNCFRSKQSIIIHPCRWF